MGDQVLRRRVAGNRDVIVEGSDDVGRGVFEEGSDRTQRVRDVEPIDRCVGIRNNEGAVARGRTDGIRGILPLGIVSILHTMLAVRSGPRPPRAAEAIPIETATAPAGN